MVEAEVGIEPGGIGGTDGVEVEQGVSQRQQGIDRIGRRPALAAGKAERCRKQRPQRLEIASRRRAFLPAQRFGTGVGGAAGQGGIEPLAALDQGKAQIGPLCQGIAQQLALPAQFGRHQVVGPARLPGRVIEVAILAETQGQVVVRPPEHEGDAVEVARVENQHCHAGTGQCGPSAGDGGPASAATLSGNVYGLAVDATGNVWLADPDAHRIRKVAPDGTISTVTQVLFAPMGISASASGDLYAVERASSALYRISGAGTVTLVAGIPGGGGFSGDGGPAVDAKLNMPWAASVGAGRILIADAVNHRIRSVAAEVLPIPARPARTCASEGYTNTKLRWCQEICEKGNTGATLDAWIHRWVNRYRDLPYCARDDDEEESPPE